MVGIKKDRIASLSRANYYDVDLSPAPSVIDCEGERGRGETSGCERVSEGRKGDTTQSIIL